MCWCIACYQINHSYNNIFIIAIIVFIIKIAFVANVMEYAHNVGYYFVWIQISLIFF